jgi:Mannosyltransferase (PIG-V)
MSTGVASRLDRFRPDLASVGVWLASRLAVVIAAVYASWVLTGQPGVFIGGPGELAPERSPVSMWDRWDVEWYRSIAVEGYLAPGHENNIAFLPGLPLLLRGFHSVGIDVPLAGLAVSLIAGLVAAVALGRLTQAAGGAPSLGVVAWVCAPMAVFLAAPYAEALFGAFAFWAWLLARRGAWVWAGVLAGIATLVRVNGLFLAVGLAVLFVTSSPRTWARGSALLLPFAAASGYVAYLHSLTGSWTAWTDAQRTGWGRDFTSPIEAVRTTFEMGFTNGVSAGFAVQYRLEIAFMVVILAFAVVLAVKRWWGELTYVLLTCVALGTSTLFYSVPRSMLTLFPIWVLLGVWMSRRRSVLVLYIAVCAPMMVLGVAAFVTGRWVA